MADDFTTIVGTDNLTDLPTLLAGIHTDLRSCRADSYGSGGSVPPEGLPTDVVSGELIVNTDDGIIYQRRLVEGSYAPIGRVNDACWGLLPVAGHPLTGQPIPMQVDLDLNSRKLLRVANGVNDTDGVNLGQLSAAVTGLSGQQLIHYRWFTAWEGASFAGNTAIDNLKDSGRKLTLPGVAGASLWWALYQRSTIGDGTPTHAWVLWMPHISNGVSSNPDNAINLMQQYSGADLGESPSIGLTFTEVGDNLEVEVDANLMSTQTGKDRIQFGFMANAADGAGGSWSG
jgi:hypothetical protein